MSPDAATLIVTGATSGIGLETARRLAMTARRVVVQGPESTHDAQGALRALSAGTAAVRYVSCDFENLSEVAAAAHTMVETAAGPVDAVINNAAVPGALQRRVTPDGHERTLQVNYLAMVLLTEHLLPALADGARVVNLASATHRMTSLDLPDIELEQDYDQVRAYARSKLAIILYTRWLAAERLADLPVTPVCLNPGVISTSLLHAMFGAQGADVGRGARNVISALMDDARGGDYFDDGRLVQPSDEALDADLGDALMSWTLDALRPYSPTTSPRPDGSSSRGSHTRPGGT
ncbi:SDR family NAD(P)-dependent oxidoreductase [Xylanimonas ulmi]|uniref:NAD(P)-dependent dehydrogenase (Short-subunit alcohol dehydrogenase family) n=1 Tax=Xylanimonas ulmi TaxID=228973 RepID=A0A4Q7M0D9_9MICO|nr:SDR family NAD(P)-dependent oxidoreductase [Xylanibacterium ulmi]RZS60197.1 NAD(P)-dependent dehydrogenase (short-subunit alcohol dehydrogenase family) [Xylanibacterium ulmi]